MKKTLSIALVILLVIVLPSMAFAGSPWTDKPTYIEKAMGKLTFGLKNMTLGWTELLSRPMESPKNVKGIFKGLGEGAMNTVVYTVGGALHIVTFPITSLDVPIRHGGVKF